MAGQVKGAGFNRQNGYASQYHKPGDLTARARETRRVLKAHFEAAIALLPEDEREDFKITPEARSEGKGLLQRFFQADRVHHIAQNPALLATLRSSPEFIHRYNAAQQAAARKSKASPKVAAAKSALEALL